MQSNSVNETSKSNDTAKQANESQELPKITKKEKTFLEAVLEGIHAESKDDYCFIDSFDVEGMDEYEQIKILHQLNEKKILIVEDGNGNGVRIRITDVVPKLLDDDFIKSFKHEFKTLEYITIAPAPKPEKTEKRTILSKKGVRRIGQIIRRVYRSRMMKVSVTHDPKTDIYTVKCEGGSPEKFKSIGEGAFDLRPISISEEKTTIQFKESD